YLRRAGREVLLDDDGWNRWEPHGGERSPVEAAQQAELEAQLAAALDRLSPLQRRVLLLRYYGNLEFAEIAAALECPLSTALSHCHRGLQVLRKLMAPTEA
ncbi:MAG: sigma factor-like helix-turn-helix DNA-binding protein, partial [Pirellulales bacterium]